MSIRGQKKKFIEYLSKDNDSFYVSRVISALENELPKMRESLTVHKTPKSVYSLTYSDLSEMRFYTSLEIRCEDQSDDKNLLGTALTWLMLFKLHEEANGQS